MWHLPCTLCETQPFIYIVILITVAITSEIIMCSCDIAGAHQASKGAFNSVYYIDIKISSACAIKVAK